METLTEEQKQDLEVRKDLSNYANRKSKLAKNAATTPKIVGIENDNSI